MKIAALALILFISIAVNLPDSIVGRLGFEPNYLLAALAAVAIAGLVAHRNLALIVLVVVMCVGANLPADVASGWGLNRDYLTAGLFAVALFPLLVRLLGWD